MTLELVYEFIIGFCELFFLYKVVSMKIGSSSKVKTYIFYVAFIMFIGYNCMRLIYLLDFISKEYNISYRNNIFDYAYITILLCLLNHKNIWEVCYYVIVSYILIMIISITYTLFFFFAILSSSMNFIEMVYKVFAMYMMFTIMKKKSLLTLINYSEEWKANYIVMVGICSFSYLLIRNISNITLTNTITLHFLQDMLYTLVIVFFFVFLYYIKITNEKNQYIKTVELMVEEEMLQKKILSDLLQANEENRRLRHDLKYHMLLLEDKIKDDPNKALHYLSYLNNTVEVVKVAETKNQVLNHVINTKALIAEKEKISFRFEIFDSLQQIDDFDLITVLGNMLDNAIEAQAYVENKKISLSIRDLQTASEIVVKNTCDPSRLKTHKKSLISIKKNKEKHGFGLKTIEAYCEKYHVKRSIRIDNTTFYVSLKIPKNMSD